MNKKETFREYLMEKCTNETHALDDMLPDVYEDWIAEQDVEDIIDWAEKWAKPTTPVDSKQTAKEHDDKIREEAVLYCINKLSGKPECTKEDPCGCHFGEVFHADGRCNCDLAREYLKSLSGDTK